MIDLTLCVFPHLTWRTSSMISSPGAHAEILGQGTVEQSHDEALDPVHIIYSGGGKGGPEKQGRRRGGAV